MFEGIIKRVEHNVKNVDSTRRLIIFGDSFAEYHEHDTNEKRWQSVTAENSHCSKIVCYARNGSSLFFSMQSIYYYVQNDYNIDDILVFVPTSQGRLPLIWDIDSDLYKNDKPEPGWQASGLMYLQGQMSEKNRQYKFMKRNDTVVQWLLKEFCTYENHAMLLNNSIGYFNSLRNKKVVIPAFKFKYENYVLDSPYCLCDISLREIKEGELSDIIHDPRKNHLHPDNHVILGKQLSNYFSTMNMDLFDEKEFRTDIYTSVEMYKKDK